MADTLHFISSVYEAADFFARVEQRNLPYPFIHFDFLAALEDSGSVGGNTGWEVFHAVLLNNGAIKAFMPLYKKQDSYGEYVFDHSWAQAYYQYGLQYYPKLVNAIPFSPVLGPRALGEPAKVLRLYQLLDEHFTADMTRSIAQLQQTAEGENQSLSDDLAKLISGVHILFADDAREQAARAEMAIRKNVNFHWFNRNYQSFDDFTATFSSRKRKNTRKEREKIAAQGVSLERLVGNEISDEAWDAFLIFYQQTYLKRSGHTGYLTKDFFKRLFASSLRKQILLVMAKSDDRYIGGALCLFDADTLYGRYWGCIDSAKFLHFEACYYQGIEFCIERGLSRFDPGVQGEHKLQRGFEPVYTHSYHKLFLPPFQKAIKQFVEEEAKHHEAYFKQAQSYLPFKKNDT